MKNFSYQLANGSIGSIDADRLLLDEKTGQKVLYIEQRIVAVIPVEAAIIETRFEPTTKEKGI